MNLMHLKYAVEISRVGSLNKAAESLYVGQPNLSRAIKELELSLGITIFERSSRGMVPTAQGEEFLGYAKKILKEIDEIEKLYIVGESQKQTFSISVPRASYISRAFSNFSQKIDKTKPADLFYKETNAMRSIKNILESDYHLGILRYASKHDKYFKELLEEKGLVYETVTEFTYSLIMSNEHPLASKEQIQFKDLIPYIEIAHADPFVPSMPMSAVRKEELPSDIDKRIFVFERASQFDLLNANPETFMWVSPVPEDLLARFGLVSKKCIDNEKKYTDILIHKRDYKLSLLDKAFIEELYKSKKKYLG